jgi:AcrR family transcriptional regulator
VRGGRLERADEEPDEDRQEAECRGHRQQQAAQAHGCREGIWGHQGSFQRVEFNTLILACEQLRFNAVARSQSPRRGRRAGAAGTRESILAAARSLFAEHGYDGTTIRAVAALAAVDPALVMHYFGSKSGLFLAAAQWPFDPRELIDDALAEGPEHVARRLLAGVLRAWDSVGDRNPALTVLRVAATDSRQVAVVRAFVERELTGRLTRRLEVDQQQLRAALVAAQLLGLAVARDVLRLAPLPDLSHAELTAAYAPSLQRLLTGELASAE